MALYVPHSIFHLARLLYVRPETFGPYYVCYSFLWGTGGSTPVLLPRTLSVFRVPTRKLRDSLLFHVSPSFKNSPSSPGVPLRQIPVCGDSDIPIRQTVTLRQNGCYFQFILLKPTGHVMHQQFNIQQLYVLPTLYLCVLYLSENKQRLVSLVS